MNRPRRTPEGHPYRVVRLRETSELLDEWYREHEIDWSSQDQRTEHAVAEAR